MVPQLLANTDQIKNMMDYQYVFFKASFFGYFQILCMLIRSEVVKEKNACVSFMQSHSMSIKQPN
jgi:hypothetical protein